MRQRFTCLGLFGLFGALGLTAVGCGSSSSDAGTSDTGAPVDSSLDTIPSGDVGTDTTPSFDAGCSPLPTDTTKSKREACTFKAGAKVADTLGLDATARGKIPISHVIVVMKENRAFDHLFGSLAKTRKDVEGFSADFSNPDKAGANVTAFHQTTTCQKEDPEHQWANMHNMWNTGKNDGFVKNAIDHSTILDKPVVSDGKFVMGYYDRTDLPFYYFLADTYALADHYHCDALAGTWSNRSFLYAGTSHGVKDTNGLASDFKDLAPLIMDSLEKAGVTWGAYTEDTLVFDGALLTSNYDPKKIGKEADFFKQLADGTLPQVVFIDAGLNTSDEHPPGDIQAGEAWTKKVYDAVTTSPLWLKDGKGMAMFYTYDESGGFFDHVAPPKACVPGADTPDFDNYGFRVPFVAISPFSRRGYVSHLLHSHASLARFIETLFDLPALSNRDANSDALLDMFDFGCSPLTALPAAPAAGTGGCKP